MENLDRRLILNNFLMKLAKIRLSGIVTSVHTVILIRFILVSVLLYTMLYIAWVGDDAHFTLKQVLNFINGQGIVYNFETRVQGFTHPLWFLVLSLFVFFTKEVYITTIVLSITFSLSAILLLFAVEKNRYIENYRTFTPVIFLLFSWAFLDYTSSGLENPLSYFLTGILLYFVFNNNKNRYYQYIFLILALIVLTRHDHGIIFFPLALVLIFDCKTLSKICISVLPGVLLLLIWHIFSTLYFGTPFPNTFYAKILAGYPAEEYYERGLEYILNMKYDLPSVILVCVSIIFSFFTKNKYLISLSIGKLLYIYYIFSVGGDFMSGRFFSLLVFLSVGNLILMPKMVSWKTSYHISVILLLCIHYFEIPFRFPVLVTQYDTSRGPLDFGGALDERFVYYDRFGLLSDHRIGWPNIYGVIKNKPEKYHIRCGLLGAYSAQNPNIYVIDQCALIDPFLSRMPAVSVAHWRVGHNIRKIPTNFGEFLIGEVESVKDEMLNELFIDVDLIARKKLFTLERFKAIWRLNTNYDYGVDWMNYTDPFMWVTNSTFFQKDVFGNWDIPLTNIDSSLNWEVASNSPKITDRFLVDITSNYSFDVYVNDKLLLNLKEGIRCKHGKLIHLQSLTELHSIKFLAVDSIPPDLPNQTHIKFLDVLSANDPTPDIEPNCTFKQE